MPFCPNCGKRVADGSTTCQNCGHPLNFKAAYAPKVCPTCGYEFKPGDNFCPKCGINPNGMPRTDNPAPSGNVPLPVTPWGKEVHGEKSSVLAFIISLFIPGSGTMYAGCIVRGIVLLLLPILLPIFFIMLTTMILDSDSVILFAMMLMIYIAPALAYLYSLYDGCHRCHVNNVLWREYLRSR